MFEGYKFRRIKDMVNAEEDEYQYHLVEDRLPENDEQVEVIGRYLYSDENVRLESARFDPQTGWCTRLSKVIAWRPLTKQAKEIFKQHKKKES